MIWSHSRKGIAWFKLLFCKGNYIYGQGSILNRVLFIKIVVLFEKTWFNTC